MKIKVWVKRDWTLGIMCLVLFLLLVVFTIRSFNFPKLIFSGIILIFIIYTSYFRFARKEHSKVINCERYEVVDER